MFRQRIKLIKNFSKPFTVPTNARSLAPKMRSLIDYIEELDTAVTIITESWLKPGRQLQEDIEDLHLSLLHCSRKSNRGRNAGGGVTLVYNKSKIELTEYKVKKAKSEMVCAIGKMPNLMRKLLIIGIYISPRVRSRQYHFMLKAVSDAILNAKSKLENPIVIVTGDLNHTNIEESIEEFPDIRRLATETTRGSSTLDFIATNIHEQVTEIQTMTPLVTNDGRESDHAVIFTRIKLNVTN